MVIGILPALVVIHNLQSNKNSSTSLEQQALINPTQNMNDVMVNQDPYLSKKTSSSSVNQAPVKQIQKLIPSTLQIQDQFKQKSTQKTFPSSL